MRKVILLASLALAFPIIISAQDLKVPTFEEVLSLPGIGSPSISPDGNHIMYSVSRYDWQENRRDTEIWLVKNGEEPFQLTHTPKGSSSGAIWSPDSKWIIFRASRGGGTQLHAIRVAGGEARPISSQVKGNIGGIEFSPDGKHIAFTMTPKEAHNEKKRQEQFGKYSVDDGEFKKSTLHLIAFEPDHALPEELPCYEKSDSLKSIHCITLPKPEALIEEVDYTITDFSWSPDGKYIVFDKQPNPDRNSFFQSDIGLLEVASKTVTTLIDNPSYDGFVAWSPDSKHLLYGSALDNFESVYYANNRLFRIPIEGGDPTELAADFDEDIIRINWNPTGIYFIAYQKTKRHLFRIDPTSGEVSKILDSPSMIWAISFSRDGEKIAYTARDGDGLSELWKGNLASGKFEQLTQQTDLISDWAVSNSEVISWESKDGATIEGVLHKPQDYDPNKKYPLFVVIHGGPTGISTPSPVPGGVYPILQWLNKGALVLQPNYRGSAGYGGDFRKLNVRNLGVGDAWDVLSGVDHLAEQGMIDTTRMGCMGWSQGGYISAFITTTSNRFKAISVGAGISNWMTYYVNTDIHPFTRQYLKATPWEDEEIYRKTSPMTYINQAQTPTLIQHGEFDQRVPIPNAYELLQGLRDVGVPAKLIVYKGFGHGITKPKERLAATWHNWQWFNKYIWGDEVSLPFKEEADAKASDD